VFDIKRGLTDSKAKDGAIHGAGLGIHLANSTMVVSEVSPHGQCYGKVNVGDKLVGVNNVALSDCMKEPGSPTEFLAMMRSAADDAPISLNFNEIKIVNDKFAAMMRKGIEVVKHHERSTWICCGSAHRVLYMDDNLQSLIIATSKGAPTHKVFSVHELVDVTRVSDRALEIHCKSGQTIVLEIETPEANTILVKKLHALILSTHQQHGNESVMKPHKDSIVSKKGSSTKPITPPRPLSS